MKVTLEQLLRSRDERVALQQSFLQEHPEGTLLCLTVQLPGEVKRDKRSLAVAEAAVKAVREVFPARTAELLRDLETGFEGYFVVGCSPLEAKSAACRIEDTHPLGRLMDIDVIIACGAGVASELAPGVAPGAAPGLASGLSSGLASGAGTGLSSELSSGLSSGTGMSSGLASGLSSELAPEAGGHVRSLSRESVGLPPRKCLLCGRPARQCMRARTHSTAELLSEIDRLLSSAECNAL